MTQRMRIWLWILEVCEDAELWADRKLETTAMRNYGTTTLMGAWAVWVPVGWGESQWARRGRCLLVLLVRKIV